jgi:N-methylhydantoinase A/oxoprolinase/acetone carboxylase beta subunit
MPEVLSFGLGGGSRVHEDDEGNVTVGPDSVGYQLSTSAKCFGGSTLTATDIIVASGVLDVGIKPVWDTPPTPELVEKAREHMLKTLEKGVDRMKASDLEVVLLLVGGGSIIQIDSMKKAKACVRPPFYDAANAVGAAIAKVRYR